MVPTSFFGLVDRLEQECPSRPWVPVTKVAEIKTGPRTFFVHVRVPDGVASRLKEIQRSVVPDASRHQEIDHVTLVMTDRPAAGGEHAPEKVDAAMEALREVGASTEPIDARIQGWGYFDGAQKDGKARTALVALIDAPGLEHLHVDAVRALREHGIEPSDKHVFTPHVTIGYLEQNGRATRPLPPLSGSFTINKIHVAARDHHEVPLTGASAIAKAAALDAMRALTESLYATHGPEGVMRTIGANPELRGSMLGHVKTLAGAASPRPQHGLFSGVMQTQALPLRAATSGKIGADAAAFAMNTRDLRREPREAPGTGESSAAVGPAPVQGGAMSSGGGFR